ncbi:MAG: biotin--[Bacteroidaceae bacterium]|nr:biotin--[acetyl-CoA-carboxylase] ligase [Bacteroidaceae bacterium]MBR1801600.1 biotin--[acetyl-CoA-carboxylase] ligase [Bacteroidaceae bacterium]
MLMYCLDDSPRFRMIELDEVDSTNSYLKGYRPLHMTDVTLVTAEHQTAGRGQTGNTWESERGRNLLFSLLLHPTQLSASEMFVISEAIALSIREAVITAIAQPHPARDVSPAPAPRNASEQGVTVKWPNDIYVGDCKIAGILIENELRGQHIGRCIVGCGVNVNQATFAFPEATAAANASATFHRPPTPVSLLQLTGHETERRFVLEDIMEVFMHHYDRIQRGAYEAIHEAYKASLYRRDGVHIFRDSIGTFEAFIEDVEPSGHLLLRDTGGTLRRYAFKEVAFQS